MGTEFAPWEIAAFSTLALFSTLLDSTSTMFKSALFCSFILLRHSTIVSREIFWDRYRRHWRRGWCFWGRPLPFLTCDDNGEFEDTEDALAAPFPTLVLLCCSFGFVTEAEVKLSRESIIPSMVRCFSCRPLKANSTWQPSILPENNIGTKARRKEQHVQSPQSLRQ